MKRWNLKIMLKSDLCTATGEDAPGITNIKTAMEYGIPYIPARRIKGCLLNAGKEMLDNGLIEGNVLKHLFGKTGAERVAGVRVSDAHLHFVPGYLIGSDEEPLEIENYELFLTEVQHCKQDEQTYMEELFTRRRARTAMDPETGSARKHSLRTMQVVPAGIDFISCLEGELDEEEEKALINCAKGLRHIGVGITRGLGEVQCAVETVTEEDTTFEHISNTTKEKVKELNLYKPEQEIVLAYEITLDSPVVIDGADSSLPAGAVLGALAGMYLRKYSLGDNAHADEDFSRIFLHDGVQFGYGFLQRDSRVYFPCPKAIAEMREDEGKWFHIEGDKERKRKELHGLVRWEASELHMISPHREIHFHHARPIDRGIGHATNDRAVDKSIFTGEFFQYTAMSKGQTYTGTWSGKAKDIQHLVECLKDYDFHIRLGRSKTAEYGNCTFGIADVSLMEDTTISGPGGTEFMLWFLTPMISREEGTGEYTLKEEEFKKQLENVLGCKVSDFRKVAGSYITYSGYNSKWRMPSVPCPAMAPGITFYLKTDREIQPCKIERNLWGELTGRGCGQAAVRLWDEKEQGEIILDSGEASTADIKKTDAISRLLRLRDVQFQAERIAIEKLENMNEVKLPPSSAIALLAQLLRSHSKSNDFYEQIKNEAEHIRDNDKKNKIIDFIKPCEGKSYQFMKLYLENAKWKARGRSKDE